MADAYSVRECVYMVCGEYSEESERETATRLMKVGRFLCAHSKGGGFRVRRRRG